MQTTQNLPALRGEPRPKADPRFACQTLEAGFPSLPMATIDVDPCAGKDLERLIVFTVGRLGMVKLSELLPAFWAVAPGLAPETIHDHLNNLLAEGKLRLSPVGAYYVP